MAKHGKSKVNIPMALACVLLCLTLISTHLTSGLYARYTVRGTGSDSARVAKFEMLAKGELAKAEVIPGENGTYTVTVTNNSEVAVEYTLKVSLTGDTTGVTAEFDSDSGELAPGESAAHTLTMAMDWAGFTKEANAEKVTANVAFTVDVDAKQID